MASGKLLLLLLPGTFDRVNMPLSMDTWELPPSTLYVSLLESLWATEFLLSVEVSALELVAVVVAVILLRYIGCWALAVDKEEDGTKAGLLAETVVWASEKEEDTLKESFRLFSSGAVWSCSAPGLLLSPTAVPVTGRSLFPRAVCALDPSG